MTRQTARLRLPVDNLLFGATLALVVIGLWMVFDAGYAMSLGNAQYGNDAFYFVKKQAVGVVVGLAALFWMMHYGYWKLRRLAVPLLLTTLVLLVLVWVPPFGVLANGAARWLKFGPISFQPSELAKVSLTLYIAALLSRPSVNVRNLPEGLGPPLCAIAITLILIEREPDMGTAFVLLLAVLTQIYLAGARKRHLALIVAGCCLVALPMMVGFGHRGNRIQTFLHPEKDKLGIGYQIDRSRMAVGSGGWTGMGLGEGREKYYLPQANTDFIFATLAEETGFVRTVPVMLLLLLVGWRGFAIAFQTKDPFGLLLAAGIASIISWQALVNIAVATHSIPATGVPLPFISFGSSSLVFLMMGIGILLNIAQHPTPPGQAIEIEPHRPLETARRHF